MPAITPQVGDPAPDALLLTPAGQPISLAEIWRAGHDVVLVFLRHLG